jgi:hypothetical protein
MLISVSKVMFDVVAFGFQGVIVLIFDFPARTTAATVVSVTSKSVMKPFGIFARNGHFAPANFERLWLTVQVKFVGVAIGAGLGIAPNPTPNHL